MLLLKVLKKQSIADSELILAELYILATQQKYKYLVSI